MTSKPPTLTIHSWLMLPRQGDSVQGLLLPHKPCSYDWSAFSPLLNHHVNSTSNSTKH